MESLSRLLLCSIDAYETEHHAGPTTPELAEALGIPPDFGHHHLIERLQRQVVLGRISHEGARFQLTEAGRTSLARDAIQQAAPPASTDRIGEPTSARP